MSAPTSADIPGVSGPAGTLEDLPQVSRSGRRFMYIGGSLLVLALMGGLVRAKSVRATAETTERARRLTVGARGTRTWVTPAVMGAPERRLVLPGEAKPFRSVVVYAKVSGYLRELHVDRGDKVRAGEVLAVVASPELERQLQSVQADAGFKRANARRAQNLPDGLMAQRDVERDESIAQIAEAQVASLEAQRGYTLLRAPFGGVVTARFADPGALVQSAANAQSGALPLATVAQVDRLRVFTYVAQKDAPLVRRGLRATIASPDGAVVAEATVSRVTGELDPRTRTMLVEIDLDNRDGRFLPGSFLNVTLVLKAPPWVEVPAEALVVRDQKPFVGVVEETGRVHFRAVAVGAHDGQRVGLAKGLRAGELVALNLGRAATDGDLLEPVPIPTTTTGRPK